MCFENFLTGRGGRSKSVLVSRAPVKRAPRDHKKEINDKSVKDQVRLQFIVNAIYCRRKQIRNLCLLLGAF